MSTKNFYIYSILFPLLSTTANSVTRLTLDLDSDADFEVHRQSMFMVPLAGTVATDATDSFPRYTASLTEKITGRKYSNVPVQLATIFGTGGRPFILRTPIIWKKSSRIEIVLTAPANIYPFNPTPRDLRLSFIGVKVFA